MSSASLHPITVGTTTDPGTPVQVGALVCYRGRIRYEQGNVFYISAVEESPDHRYDTYTLIDRDYPSVTVLRQVSRGSIVPTGETIDMCDCGHEAGNPGRGGSSGYCEAQPCECRNHYQPRSY
jgi:hypothetical protein